MDVLPMPTQSAVDPIGDLIGQVGCTANDPEVICMCERAIAVS